MGFSHVLGDVYDSFKDAGEQSLGVITDMAKAYQSTVSHPGSFRADRAAGSQFVSSFAQRLAQYSQDHRTVSAIARGAVDTANGALTALTLPQHYQARGLSTLTQVTNDFGLAPGGVGGAAPSFGQAWKNSEHTSPGQAFIAGLQMDSHPGLTFANAPQFMERGGDKFSAQYAFSSGALDAALAFTDPIIIGGKVIKAARGAHEALRAEDVAAAVSDAEPTTRRAKAVKQEFNSIIEASDHLGAPELHDALRKKGILNTAGLASTLTQTGDAATKRMVLGAAMGSPDSLNALRATRADLAGQINRMTGELDDMLFAKELGKDSFFTMNGPDQIAELQSEISSQNHLLDYYDRILPNEDKIAEAIANESVVTPDDLGLTSSFSKRAGVTKGDLRRATTGSSYTLQAGVAGIPVRVLRAPVNMRPSGWIDLHDADQGVRELDAMTRRVPGLPAEDRQDILNRYIAAKDDNARRNVLVGVENRIFAHLGGLYGYAPEDIKHLVSRFFSERDQAMAHFKSNNYGFLKDGSVVRNPLTEAQLANGAATMNVDLVKRVLSRNAGRYAALKNLGSKTFNVVDSLGDVVNDLWKFQALLRGGYIIRNAMDSQLRLLAFLGAHQTLMADKEALSKFVRGKMAGQGMFDAGGAYNEVPDAWGMTDDQLKFYTQHISASQTRAEFIAGESSKLLDKWRGAGDWRTLLGHEPGWTDAYLRVTNQQLRQSAITQQLLRGKSPEDIVAWLKSDKGRSLRRRMVFGSDTAEELVAANVQNLEHVVPREMWSTLRDRPFNTKDIEQMWATEEARPAINAEQTAYSLGQHPVAEAYAKIRDGYFDWTSKLTDDAMGRHPLYVQLYRGKTSELLKRSDPKLSGMLDPVHQRVIQEQARLWARQEMKNILFDVSQKSDLAHFVRFMMPFYAAWQDALTKYSRLLIKDPSRLGWLAEGWTAPNDAAFIEVVDQNGKPVPANKSKLSDNEYLRIPAGIAKHFGIPYTVDISKASFNIALQGDPIWAPGWGPMGTIPVNEFVRHTDNPTLANVAQQLGILPFGVQDNGTLGWKAFEASTLRQASMPEARLARLKAMILQEETFKARQEGKPLPTAKEVNRKFHELVALRFFTSALSPVSVQYKSPYQFYIDQSHAYDAQIGKKYKDSTAADLAFLRDYGPDYYLFRASMSKTNVPIAPSRTADAAARKLKDLIDRFPAYGAMFIGKANYDGKYDQNVYTLQSSRKIGSSSDTWRDTYSDPRQALAKNNAELGWIEYQKLMSRLDAVLIARGLHSYQQKGAADLAKIKHDWVESVAGPQGPAWGADWYDDYNSNDDGAIVKFLRAAKAATADSRINDRGDIRSLAAYLKVRAAYRKILQARPTHTLSDSPGSPNYDLYQQWAAFTGALVDGNHVFGDLYHRYLENDDLSKVVN